MKQPPCRHLCSMPDGNGRICCLTGRLISARGCPESCWGYREPERRCIVDGRFA